MGEHPHTRSTTVPRLPKYPTRRAFRLLVGCCVLSHPAEAIKIRGPITLSILTFFVALFATQNDDKTSSLTCSAHPNLLSNAPHTAKTIVWLFVASIH
jgi:hypothetical protein